MFVIFLIILLSDRFPSLFVSGLGNQCLESFVQLGFKSRFGRVNLAFVIFAVRFCMLSLGKDIRDGLFRAGVLPCILSHLFLCIEGGNNGPRRFGVLEAVSVAIPVEYKSLVSFS